MTYSDFPNETFFHTWPNLYPPPPLPHSYEIEAIFALFGHHSNSQADLTSMAGFLLLTVEMEKAGSSEANYLSFCLFSFIPPLTWEGLNENFLRSSYHMVITYHSLHVFMCQVISSSFILFILRCILISPRMKKKKKKRYLEDPFCRITGFCAAGVCANGDIYSEILRSV